jgi:hypothetical protein
MMQPYNSVFNLARLWTCHPLRESRGRGAMVATARSGAEPQTIPHQVPSDNAHNPRCERFPTGGMSPTRLR